VEAMTIDAARLVRELKRIRPGLPIVAKPQPLTRRKLLERVGEALAG
jgi:hypothetical protein